MFHSLRCYVVALLWMCAALACNAQDAADQQGERLHVQRLANGFVAITTVQQVHHSAFFFVTHIDCESMLIISLSFAFLFIQPQVTLSYIGDRPTFFDQFPRPLAQVVQFALRLKCRGLIDAVL